MVTSTIITEAGTHMKSAIFMLFYVSWLSEKLFSFITITNNNNNK